MSAAWTARREEGLVNLHPERPFVVGVVPTAHDGYHAPAEGMVLTPLLGTSLLRRSVCALMDSNTVDHILVPAASAAVRPIEQDLSGLGTSGIGTAARVSVLPVDSPTGALGVLAALEHPAAPADGMIDGLVILHDPLHALIDSDQVLAVVDELLRIDQVSAQACAGVLATKAVTDTVKVIDENGAIVRTEDRENYVVVTGPQVYRYPTLLAALRAAQPSQLCRPGADQVPRLVHAAGGSLRSVPAPAEQTPVFNSDDLVLAESLLMSRDR